MKKNINICVFIGSCNKVSTTQYLAEQIIKRYKIITNNVIKVHSFCGSKINILDCMGCTNCFLSGKCVLDRQDDMQNIKKALLNADVIILGSPVYFHAVSGTMKRMIDRISYWTHTMELTGKYGISIATSGGNGLCYVTDYLQKFFDYLGVQHIAKLEVATYNMDYVVKNNLIDKIDAHINECVEMLISYVDNEKYFMPEKRQSQIFEAYKKKNHDFEQYRNEVAEVSRWFESGFDKCDNYEEAIRRKQQKYAQIKLLKR